MANPQLCTHLPSRAIDGLEFGSSPGPVRRTAFSPSSKRQGGAGVFLRAVKQWGFPFLFLIAIGGGMTMSNADTASKELGLAKFWGASVTAETNKDYDQALDQINAYQQQGGDKFLVTLRCGWLYYLKQDYNKASACYLAANQMQPSSLNVLLGLLNVAQAQNDPFKIQHAADAVMRIEPSNYRAQMALAGAYYAKKDYRSAISTFRRILLYYPDDIGAMSGEAWCSFYLADMQQALRGFSKILSVNPDYPYAKQGYDLASGKSPGGSPQSGTVQPSPGLQPAGGF